MQNRLNKTNIVGFKSLKGNDVITAQISDHHPVIHDGALFWNIMMQAKLRNASTYNNGFGMVEDEKEYENRLVKVAKVIAEIIYFNPNIETIGLCEGPIKSNHCDILFNNLKKFSWMKRFFRYDDFHKPNLSQYPNWGLLMLADKKYQVSKLGVVFNSELYDKLANRLQIWRLKNNDHEKYFALAHFPFGGNEFVNDKAKLSKVGNIYSDLVNNLLKQYSDSEFIFCADFNLNPYLINQWRDRVLDEIPFNNSILLTNSTLNQKNTQSVTVDGVLLSMSEKRKYNSSLSYLGLFGLLRQEYQLLKKSFSKQEQSNEELKYALSLA